LADVAFGVGIVGAGVATYLFVTSRSQPGPAAVARRPRIEPRLGPGLIGLAIGARW
jgi:hypothetical protein